jgi:hypothetical protein
VFVEEKKGVIHYKTDMVDEFWKNNQLVQYWIKPEQNGDTYKGSHIKLVDGNILVHFQSQYYNYLAAKHPPSSFEIPKHWNCPSQTQQNETIVADCDVSLFINRVMDNELQARLQG